MVDCQFPTPIRLAESRRLSIAVPDGAVYTHALDAPPGVRKSPWTLRTVSCGHAGYTANRDASPLAASQLPQTSVAVNVPACAVAGPASAKPMTATMLRSRRREV